jgi:uncharacterized repeat protein (TIGR01451 family)
MKMVRLFCGLFLLAMCLTIGLPGTALAQDEGQPAADNITLSASYPTIEAIATGSFVFEVKLTYQGTTDRIFDLNTTVPVNWDSYINPQYDATKISTITMEKSVFSPTSKIVKMNVTPPAWPLADPGEYKLTLEAVSGNVSNKIDLVAKITARYNLMVVPTNQLYNTNAKAGRDNTFSIQVTNLGTATIDNITFSSVKPDGWQITYQPEKIDLLQIADPKTIDVVIKPPPKTVAGDYMITLNVSGKQAAADKMNIRVTVETPTIWGWVGVGIIVVVVIGLIAIFMRFGRR